MPQFFELWVNSFFQHIEVTGGSHSHVNVEKKPDQKFVLQAIAYGNFISVSNVLHCSKRMILAQMPRLFPLKCGI